MKLYALALGKSEKAKEDAMIVATRKDRWLHVEVPQTCNEDTATKLLQALGWDVYLVPPSAQDVVREGAVKLAALLQEMYNSGEMWNESFMEWVSSDESHSMVVFNGHIIATVEATPDVEIIRWFQGTDRFVKKRGSL